MEEQPAQERKEYPTFLLRDQQRAIVGGEEERQGAFGLPVRWLSDHRGFQSLRLAEKKNNQSTMMPYKDKDKYVQRGTGPLRLVDEGDTAKVRLIISKTEAIEPRARSIMLLPLFVSVSKLF